MNIDNNNQDYQKLEETFIGPRYQALKNSKFSVLALFLGDTYYFYRKMFFNGLLLEILNILLIEFCLPLYFLVLTEPNNLLETGIEIQAVPSGKSLKSLSLLSGGEKTFTAISLLFAILNVRPVPFCLLDEVEAALDDANVESFGKYLNKYRDKTQFILITHKKKTMEFANILYGITMQESGVSKLVSVKLEDIKDNN